VLKRRLKVLLKFLFLLFVVLFVFLLIERWRGQISLARYKRVLAIKGETLDVRKLLAPPVADADNGASDLMRLDAMIHEGKIIPKNYPPKMKLIAPGKAMVGYRETFWVEEKVTNTWEDVSLDLYTNRQTLEQLRVVLAKPAFDFKLDRSHGFDMILHHLPPAKSLCQWLGPACQDSLRKGENQAALDALLAAIAIPRVMENDHHAISELVRIAISSINLGITWEALQADVWTDDQLAMIQKAWEKNTFETNMIQSLRIERAQGQIYVDRFQKSNDETYKSMFPTWLSTLTGDDESDSSHWWQQEFFRKQIYCRVWRFAWLHQDENFHLEGMQRLIDDKRTGAEKAEQPVDVYWFGLAKAPHQNFYNNWRFGMSAQSLATLSLATVKAARSETDRSMVLCAIALKRYSLRHGKPPPDLSALVPEFLPSVPIDNMDGKPMKYHLQSDGTWRLYSVGDDGRDDGGDASPTKPDQTYLWIWRGKDVVWPLPATSEELEVWRKQAAKN
jgi:hypothetical protein